MRASLWLYSSLWLYLSGASLAVTAALITPAAADQLHDQITSCTNEDGRHQPDVAIKACSALIGALNQSLKLHPKTRDQVLGLEAETLKDRAKAYVGKMDYDHAIADFTQAIADYMAMKGPKVASRVAGAYAARAALYLYIKRDYNAVIADATQAITLSPDDAKAYELRALAYKEKGETDKALADFDWAINLTPKDAQMLSERAQAYLQKSDYDHALADYAEAIAIDSKKADLWLHRCYANELKGNDTDALADCNVAIQLEPNNALAIYLRGVAKLGLGDRAGSDADIARAKTLDPQLAKPTDGSK